MAELLNGKVNLIAFYLPQYHSIPENDMAWGKGFTEWTNVRKASPLFKGHVQPKIPLNNNYYNLMDDNIAEWQSNIAQENGIFGFCYYHYWFKNGKKLLEKPAERMLATKSITIPFCFCWANENWSKRWDGGTDEVIVEQDYGDERDWEDHFRYLLPFLQDSRYITMNNRPVLIIYRPDEIDRLNEMISYLRRRTVEEGLAGLTVIFQHPRALMNCVENANDLCKAFENYSKKIDFDYYIMFEPLFTWQEQKMKSTIGRIQDKINNRIKRMIYHTVKGTPILYDYDNVWKRILNRNNCHDRMLTGAFVNWDNTPRRKDGQVIINSSPLKFEKYLTELVQKVKTSSNHRVIFITAWNEWGEGCYLEPDDMNGYSYLNAVSNSIG